MDKKQNLRAFNLALKWLAIPVLVFFVLLAIPIVGNLLVIEGAHWLGCNTAENDIHPCQFLEWDIGELVSGYTVDAFIGGAANPLIAAYAFLAFIRSFIGAIWLLLLVSVFAARELRRKKSMAKTPS
ncbi:hypothetical protein [Dyella sp. 2HG41-7]|uniref:hypothetical protein n=1 Tax=Dyella sp. 2HG41-7 TaxID=2883239 RepID=UPI001F393C8D|nr:hypothetical protein [Dyella sp. 2HG41-7]